MIVTDHIDEKGCFRDLRTSQDAVDCSHLLLHVDLEPWFSMRGPIEDPTSAC